MKEFHALREAARSKRDNAISRARAEFEATLVAIAKLEQDMLGGMNRQLKITASIESVIPPHKPFTVTDIMQSLEERDPGRTWRRRAIDGHITRLRAKKIVRRVRKAKGSDPAIYVRADAVIPKWPFEDMTLVEVISAVLTEPMTRTEVAVVMLERGYETTMQRKYFCNTVGATLRKHVELFRCKESKWERVQD